MSSKIEAKINDAQVYEIKNTIFVESDKYYFVIKKGKLNHNVCLN